MSFSESVKICMTKKYMDFDGRASRSEYWWFTLLVFFIHLLLSVFFDYDKRSGGIPPELIFQLFVLAVLFLPTLSVQVRRLHDIGRSGTWVILYWVPVLSFILVYWALKKSETGTNRFGPQPLETL